jgi:hypothetical protein
MVAQKSRWDDVGVEPGAGAAKYTAGGQPIAEHDNWFNKAVVDDLLAPINIHNTARGYHEGGVVKHDGTNVVFISKFGVLLVNGKKKLVDTVYSPFAAAAGDVLYITVADFTTDEMTLPLKKVALASINTLTSRDVVLGVVAANGVLSMLEGINTVDSITDHAALTNLDYASSGHTGFEASANKNVTGGYVGIGPSGELQLLINGGNALLYNVNGEGILRITRLGVNQYDQPEIETAAGVWKKLERVDNKGIANGYASLDASSKVVQDPANATSAPAANKIPLADASGKLASGWGGAANSLATLDGDTKVVQDPASLIKSALTADETINNTGTWQNFTNWSGFTLPNGKTALIRLTITGNKSGAGGAPEFRLYLSSGTLGSNVFTSLKGINDSNTIVQKVDVEIQEYINNSTLSTSIYFISIFNTSGGDITVTPQKRTGGDPYYAKRYTTNYVVQLI